MTQPLISIIVPVYNAEKTLQCCINSILNQTIDDFEIILVDDGSTDRSYIICEQLANTSDKIRVIHKNNGGAASARNIGIDNSKGEFIGFVDSDDYIEKDMYYDLINIMKEKQLNVLDSLRYKDDIKNMTCIESSNQTGNLIEESAEDAIKQMLIWKGNSSLCTRVFRRSFLQDIRIPEGHKVEDFRFMLDVHKLAGKNVIYQKAYYHVVPIEGSVTRAGFSSVFFDAIYQANEARKFVMKYYPQLNEAVDCFQLYCIYNFMVNIPKQVLNEHIDYCQKLKKNVKKGIISLIFNRYIDIKKKIILFTIVINMRLPNILYNLLNKK